MLKGIKYSAKLITQASPGDKAQKVLYASLAGRSTIPKEQNIFTKEELKHLINNHIQLITDFNLIYEDPTQIKLYQIGTLFTKPIKGSYNVSKVKNYTLEEKPQELKFFKNVIPVKYDLHVIAKSKEYFQHKETRKIIEETIEYKEMFNKVLKKFKLKNIKVRPALNEEEMISTGLEILTKNELINNEKLFVKIPITTDET